MIGPEGLGGDIKEVLKFPAIRGKFSSVHPELRREGITKIEVGKEGLRFLRDSGEKRRLTKRKYRYIDVLIYWIEGLPDGSREPKEIVVSRQKDTEEFKFYRRLVSIISLEDVEENEEDRVQEAEDDMVDQAIALSRAESCESYDSGLQQAIRLSQTENKAKRESYESDDRELQKAIELSSAEKKEAKEYDTDLLEQAIALSLAEISDNEFDPKSNWIWNGPKLNWKFINMLLFSFFLFSGGKALKSAKSLI